MTNKGFGSWTSLPILWNCRIFDGQSISITTSQLTVDSGPSFSFLCLKLILNVSGLGNTKLESVKDMHNKGERNSPEWKRAD